MKKAKTKDEPKPKKGKQQGESQGVNPTLVIAGVGLVFGAGGIYLFTRLLGLNTALPYLLTGLLVTAIVVQLSRIARRVNVGRETNPAKRVLALADPDGPEVANALARISPIDPKEDPRRKDQEGDPVQGPSEETLEEKYNKRLEFPLSVVGSILIHVLIVAVLGYLILVLMAKPEDKGSVDVKSLAVGGLDDFGAGSAGSGGQEDPLLERANANPETAAVDSLLDPSELPKVKEEIQQTIKLLDPSGNTPVTSSNAAALAHLDKNLRDKLMGMQRGSGNEKGKGFDGSKGSGPGGSGADSTFGRGMRWNLRFNVRSGRDYLEQLRMLGAKICVPVPGTEQFILIEDLNNLDRRKSVGVDLGGYARLLQFTDARKDVVREIAGTLALDFNPKMFFAMFSNEFQEELAAKEKAFRNRRAEDIEETVFSVTIRAGKADVTVVEQKVKK